MIVFQEISIFLWHLPLNFFPGYLQVEELEKEILDSREKTEFYRSKMQEIVSIFALSFF